MNNEEIKNLIKNSIIFSSIDNLDINNAKYHHNSSYKNASNICKYGILSLKDLNKYGLRNDSEETLKKLDDISSHANGINSVSLSVVGLDDLYKDELVYDPYELDVVDFLVSNDITARRYSVNYGNEYLCNESISNKYIKSLDIRLLKLIQSNKCNLNDLIDYYNYLIDISKTLLDTNIPIRESSYDSIELNKKVLANKTYIKL